MNTASARKATGAESPRSAGAWTMTALGEPATCTTFAELLQVIGRHG
ncbi:hypothetical protein ACIBW9_38610 [Streptomyces sp. NPDC049541]